MRKSREVPLTLLAALTQFVTGRRDVPESRYCVDEAGKIVPDFNCENSTLGMSYHYVYGGSSDGNIGDVVVGGNATSKRESEVSRGGFGFGSGGSAGG
ncbi:MAG: hypothetical protein ABSD67_22985 [Terracidiphilus sp.]|jgi:hypothetical protein